jgi:hypothetical protein
VKLQNVIWRHLPFIIILLVALFFRVHKISTLTTFGRDQGIDFLSVKKMIVERKPTLLGIKVSIAAFHQGPVYLYMLVPLFILLNLDPIAGAYTAVAVAALTGLLLYMLTNRFFNRSSALWSSALFAVSPAFVREGTTPLYQHFLPLFILFGMYALLSLTDKKTIKNKHVWALSLGLSMGICLELHFLAITLVGAVLIQLFFNKTLPKKNILWYVVGLGFGVSPTIAFEVRHNFLNTNLFLDYMMSSGGGIASRTFTDYVSPWIYGAARWYGADYFWLGLIILLSCFYFIVFRRFSDARIEMLRQLLIIVSVVTTLFQLVTRSFEPHYAQPIWVLLLIFLPLLIEQSKSMWKIIFELVAVVLICLNAFVVLQAFSTNHGYYMVDGWSLKKVQAATQLIAEDAQNKERINVASLLDGDTRIYPLRYTLSTKNISVDSEENYSNSKTLYVLSKGDEQSVTDSLVWEISSFQPFVLGKVWDLGDGIMVYRLDKE